MGLGFSLFVYSFSFQIDEQGSDCLYPPKLWMLSVQATTFVLSPVTNMWIECDGSTIAAVTSHPIDKTDLRQDTRQHGTKLVWAWVPSDLLLRPRWLLLLACSLAHPTPSSNCDFCWTGLVRVSETQGMVRGSCTGILEMKGRIDKDTVFAFTQLPLFIVASWLGLLIKLSIVCHKELLGRGSVKKLFMFGTFV